jgi:hypothetical protein
MRPDDESANIGNGRFTNRERRFVRRRIVPTGTRERMIACPIPHPRRFLWKRFSGAQHIVSGIRMVMTFLPRFPYGVECRLPGQLEVHAAIKTIQLECAGAIDGTDRRFIQFSLQTNEVEGPRRIPIILSQPNVILVC